MYDQYPYLNAGPPRQREAFGQSPTSAAHWMLPVGRSWQSIVSGYLGLISLIIWPLGPIAVAMGWWALARAARHAGHGRGRAVFAIISGLLSTTFLAVLLLAAL